MKRLIIGLLILAPLLSPAQAGLRIFACEPEWAALARELTPPGTHIDTATTAKQDVHHIQARPSLISKLRRADLLVCTGAGLEVGWLPLLVRQSGNAKVQAGSPGHFEAAMQVERLESAVVLDRALGDVHPQGNPHVQLDPRRIALIARALSERLIEIDPGQAPAYQARYAAFDTRWQAAIARWTQAAAPLKGERIVTHHKTWLYLFDWLGIESAGTLEPKPGLPPTASHLATLKAELDQRPARMIIHAAYINGKAAHWLSENTGIPARELPHTVDGTDEAKDLFSLFDTLIDRLLQSGAGETHT